jgi:hypothetical protein
VTLCAFKIKIAPEGKRLAISDFLKRGLVSLKEFRSEIFLELMEAGTWNDEVILEFKKFVNGRASAIECFVASITFYVKK